MTGDFDLNNNNTVNCTTFSYNMRKGDRDSNTGGEVSKLQELLGQNGLYVSGPYRILLVTQLFKRLKVSNLLITCQLLAM